MVNGLIYAVLLFGAHSSKARLNVIPLIEAAPVMGRAVAPAPS